MIRRSFAVWLAAALVLLCTGCGSASIKAKREITVALDATKTKTNLKLHVADLVKLELPPIEPAGFGWRVSMLDSRFLQQRSEVIPPKAPGERPTVTFLALSSTSRTPGNRTTVRFLVIKQDGSREAQPIDGHDAVVTIE